ncbi:hypothetical protein PZB74_06870 [Porifericola rhodea]|uniref:hypothetical protein n=1 Tax=Porifericola rhodea TaxID=930972 RepID=UPI0026659CCF|nr:hypothetical protein [Porifericola rhodea]WKN33065.1 hypothetical protein PZB74_06870 [Porifericola rhodea]
MDCATSHSSKLTPLSHPLDVQKGWLCRIVAILLLIITLLFSIWAVPSRLQPTAKTATEDSLTYYTSYTSYSATLSTQQLPVLPAVYFFIGVNYLPEVGIWSITLDLKERLFIPSYLRNPFYIYTSIHAP